MQAVSIAHAKHMVIGSALRLRRLLTMGVVLILVPLGPAHSTDAAPDADKAKQSAPEKPSAEAAPKGTAGKDTTLPTQVFLDRLMMAESGGRAEAKNPRSTALGPYQFIETTFLDIMRRHYPSDIAGMSEEQVLALRTSADHARRAALAYTNENAAHLTANGLEASSVNLRLAFLLGAGGATRLLTAAQDTPLSQLLAAEALAANPFMGSMTAADLVKRARYDMSDDARVAGLLPSRPSKPAIQIRCKIGLASCRRWVALQQKKLARGQQQASSR